MNYQDIHVVENFDEAEQFRYTDTNETVEVGTAVAYDEWHDDVCVMKCFAGIYYDPDGQDT